MCEEENIIGNNYRYKAYFVVWHIYILLIITIDHNSWLPYIPLLHK